MAPLISAMPSAAVPMPSFGKLIDDVVALGLGVERVDDEEDAAARLAEPDRQRAAAAALGVELHVRPQLLHVGERLVLVAAVHLEDREDARDRGARRARVGHLQHVLVGRVEQVVPRRRRLQVVLLQELVVGHEHQRIVGDRGPLAVGLLEARRQLGERRRLVGLEHAFLDAGGEGLDRAAEQHVDARIVLLGDDARERLARREAHEVDLDAGRLLEFLEHRPRPVLRPDRVDVADRRRGRRQRRASPPGTRAAPRSSFIGFPQCDSLVTWGRYSVRRAAGAISGWPRRAQRGIASGRARPSAWDRR